jgi:glycosyltransferase involved in cell wall biosynthesis
VLLPAFNQAAGLEPIVDNWLRALARLDRPVEVILVNDASTDDTAAVARKLAARTGNIRLLTHETRQGFGGSLRTALAAAKQPLVFYTACDYPYQPADLTKLLEVIDSADVVTGARTDPIPGWLRRLDTVRRVIARVVVGTQVERRPGWRGWRAWWQTMRLRLMFGLGLWDPTSAFKLYRRSVLDCLPIQSNGDFVHAELLAKANFLGCMLAEVPIGRLGGAFRGVPEPPAAGTSADARRVFRRPEFASPAQPLHPTK